jgi:hypothetical protein
MESTNLAALRYRPGHVVTHVGDPSSFETAVMGGDGLIVSGRDVSDPDGRDHHESTQSGISAVDYGDQALVADEETRFARNAACADGKQRSGHVAPADD